MNIKERMVSARNKATSVVMAGVLALGMCPLPAYATGLTAGNVDLQADGELSTQAAMSADNSVICAAFAAAEPAPDILGLNNPEERTASKATDMKLAIFGTDINSNPDPYFYNTYEYLNNGSDYTPRIITDTRVSQAPMAARLAYGSTTASDDVWKLLPDIVLSTGADAAPSNESTFYDTTDYARAVETAKSLSSGSYHPVSVTYNRTNLNTMIDVMYKLAEAADNVNGKKLRYGPAMNIAKQYEAYIIGAKAYVLKQIDNGTTKMKKVASVESYDSSSGKFTLTPYDVAEGTATANRLLEAVQGTVENLGGDNSSAKVEMNADELKEQADLIIYGGQATSDTAITALSANGLLGKTFYATNMSSGSIFGTTVNSVENAQNVGRVLSCVYPECLTQSDMMAYYYETFYHINSGNLAETIDKYMDGVRNWANNDASAYLEWTADTVSGYNKSSVESKLAEGMAYAVANKSSLSTYVQPTDNADATIEGLTLEISDDTVEYTGSALTPGFTVKKGEETVFSYDGNNTTGSGYTYAYSNNTNVGTGLLTVTQSSDGSVMRANFDIKAKDAGEDELAANDIADVQYTGSQLTPEPANVKVGSTALANGEYTVAYDNNINISTDQSKASVTITATNYIDQSGNPLTLVKEFRIVKGNLSAATLEKVEDKDYHSLYTTKAITPAVTLNGATVSNKEYDVTITAFTPQGGSPASEMPKSVKDAGTYTLTIAAKSSSTLFEGQKTGLEYIVAPGDISTYTIDEIGMVTKDASVVEPAIYSVNARTQAKDVTLTKGDDYTATAINTSNVGGYTYTATGKAPNWDTSKTLSVSYSVLGSEEDKALTASDDEENPVTVEADLSDFASALPSGATKFKLEVEELDATDSDEVNQDAVNSNTDVQLAYDVTLKAVNASGEEVSEITENFGTLKLTLAIPTKYAGSKAVVKQIHAGGLYKTFDAVTVPADGKISLETDALSTFVVNMDVTHTVTFNSNGGSAVASQTVDDNETATKPANPTRANYTFGTWTLNGEAYDFSTPVTENITLTATWTVNRVTMYRMYNPNSGEHFYTSNPAERANLIRVGWNAEGTGWIAPATSSEPVYRLYSGTDHHYTSSAGERDALIKVGWSYEGIGWYSDTSKGVPLYRQFNPNVNPSAPRNNSGSHNYTTSKAENDNLVKVGWRAEGVGWYGLK